MAQRYQPEVFEAIWALLCEGIGPAEIRRRLARGDAALPFNLDIPKRTLAGHVARMKRERGEPHPTVKPGEEINSADAIRRRGIELQGRSMAHYEQKALHGTLTAADQRAVDVIIRSIEEQKRRAEQPESVKTRKGKSMQTQREVAAPSILTALGREIAREARPSTPSDGSRMGTREAERGGRGRRGDSEGAGELVH